MRTCRQRPTHIRLGRYNDMVRRYRGTGPLYGASPPQEYGLTGITELEDPRPENNFVFCFLRAARARRRALRPSHLFQLALYISWPLRVGPRVARCVDCYRQLIPFENSEKF